MEDVDSWEIGFDEISKGVGSATFEKTEWN
jgi:hypothetical protein